MRPLLDAPGGRHSHRMTYSALLIALRARWRPIARAIRLLAASAVVLALSLACNCGPGYGERAGTGTCPAGERCATALGGLAFDGAAPSLHFLLPIALGGIERVEFRAVAPTVGDASVPVGADGGPPGLPDFLASSPSGVLEVTASERVSGLVGSATVRGLSVGSGLLRVTSNDDGALLDRIRLDVVEVADTDLHAPECSEFAQALAPDENVSLFALHILRCGAVWAGSRVRAGVTLVGAHGDTLWDDSLTHAGAAATAIAYEPDGLIFEVQAPDTGSLAFEVTGASGAHTARLPVVSEVAAIFLTGGSTSEFTLTVGVPKELCAAGAYRVADGTNGAVLGAPAEFVSDSPALELAPGYDGPDALGSRTACRTLTLTENAPHHLTVTMGSTSATFTALPALPSATALRRATTPAPRRWTTHAHSGPQLGERLPR